MTIIDTHTHLFTKQFKDDQGEVIQRAQDAGVTKMLLPNIDLSTMEAMNRLARKYPGKCLPMLGIHPCSVNENIIQDLDILSTELQKNSDNYIAFGETGLDYYWDKSYAEQQQLSLRQHIKWAKTYTKPLVLHTRDSFEDNYQIIKSENNESLTGVFHCFSGTKEEAAKVIDLEGFYLGIGGVLTFKNSQLGKEIKDIDLKYLVLETDSPYLTPAPFRGKRNESAYLTFVLEKLAEVKGVDKQEVAKITSGNAKKLFKL